MGQNLVDNGFSGPTSFVTIPESLRIVITKMMPEITRMGVARVEAFKKYKSELEGVDEIKGEKKNVNNEVKREDSIQSSQQTTLEIKNPTTDKKNVIIFKVQIETSDKQISSNVKRFNGLEVEEIQEGKIYKYVTGSF